MVSELAMQERMEGEFQASGTVCAKALRKGTACLVQYSRDHREFGFAGIVQAREVSRGWITRHPVCQAKERWLYLMGTTGGWEAGRKHSWICVWGSSLHCQQVDLPHDWETSPR